MVENNPEIVDEEANKKAWEECKQPLILTPIFRLRATRIATVMGVSRLMENNRCVVRDRMGTLNQSCHKITGKFRQEDFIMY
jgi:hypothetical protein